MPNMRPNHLYCYSNPDQVEGQLMYKMILKNNKLIRFANWILCNSLNDLQPWAMELIPRALPIGPLLSLDKRSNCRPAGIYGRRTLLASNGISIQKAPSSTLHLGA